MQKKKLHIWDGSSPTRADLSNVKNPDHADYVKIVVEFQKLQTAFLHLTENIDLIPNLQGELDAALARIVALQKIIAALTPPQELKDELKSLESALSEQDTRKDVQILRRDIEALKVNLDKNQLNILKLQEAFATQVTAFQSKIWNHLKKLEGSISDRLEAAEKKLVSVSIQTQIQSLLDGLKVND